VAFVSDSEASPPWEAPAVESTPPLLSPEAVERSRRALFVWFVILLAFGVGGLVLGQQELALLVALSGIVIAAHAADFHPQFEPFYKIVSFALVGLCAAVLVGLGVYLLNDPTGPSGPVIPIITIASAAVMLATGIRPVATALARALFSVPGDSHSLRLAARLTLFGFIVAVPGWETTRSLFDQTEDLNEVFSSLTFGGGVLGYVILALASVGFLVRRDLRATLGRLGLTRPSPRALLLIVVGVPLLWGLNAVGEWAQHQWFPATWEADRNVNEAIASVLDRRGMVVLSLSAGIGEEITIRGALQPKLGLVLTSLFFAALHVQYSVFGMAMVCVFGLILGIIRQRSNTLVAMAVHAIYDLLALLAS
jgi:hypothetical protein